MKAIDYIDYDSASCPPISVINLNEELVKLGIYQIMVLEKKKNGSILDFYIKSSNREITLETKDYHCWKLYESCLHLWFTEKLHQNDLKLENLLYSDCLSFV